jgi:signal transduction histidine kinase
MHRIYKKFIKNFGLKALKERAEAVNGNIYYKGSYGK